MLGISLAMLIGSALLMLRLSPGGSFPSPLSQEEEKKYLTQWQNGDISSRNVLVEHNLRLVAHIIKKYYTQTNDIEDLISIGTIGLIKGINTYKPDKGIRLATYASRCIENAISVEKETTIVDQQALAVAAKHCGGIVIAQVERVVASGSINPRDVIVPGILVDYAVISPAECHYQNFGNQPYDAALAHEFRVPVDSLPILPMSDRKVIARRAAMELPKNAVINLGIGMPEGVSSVAVEEGFADQLTMTVEAGQIGGVPAAGAAFGGAYNPEFVNDMIRHFDFYDGGGLDVCFLGAAEVDNMGNCNVSKFTRTVGPGGFINIASNTPKCVFCGTLTAGGLKTEIKDGKLVILQEGRNKKYMKHVKQVTFSGENAVKSGQTVLFVTERAVFELDNDGIILTEIAPGIDLQTQVLDMIDFDVRVSPNLKLMDARIFAEGPMGLELK